MSFQTEKETKEAAYGVRREFERLGVIIPELQWEYLDDAISFHGMTNRFYLNADMQKIIHAAGFDYINVHHLNKWETYYEWEGKEFASVEGWRSRERKVTGEDGKVKCVTDVVKQMETWMTQEYFDSLVASGRYNVVTEEESNA